MSGRLPSFGTSISKIVPIIFPTIAYFSWYLYLLCNNILVLRLLNRNFYFQKNWLLLHRYLKCCFIRYNLLIVMPCVMSVRLRSCKNCENFYNIVKPGLTKSGSRKIFTGRGHLFLNRAAASDYAGSIRFIFIFIWISHV